MRIAEINDVPTSSTGAIMHTIARLAWIKGYEVLTFSPALHDLPFSMPGHFFIGSLKSHLRHIKLGELTGLNGLFEISGTLKMLKEFEKNDIQLIHLHNIQGYAVNIPLLFRYIKKHNIPVIWTLHSCWAFTGKCVHFSSINCEKWKTGCGKCELLKRWPRSIVYDNSKLMWRLKKRWFTSVPNMTIVASSNWIADLAKESFLREHPIKIIYDGINLYQFHPVESDFRKEYHCEDKIVLLGVADNWLRHKGIHSVIKLSKMLDEKYRLILIGTDEQVDRILPDNIISIHHTNNKQQLVEAYSAADIFLQTTEEETFGLVNVEALACGTPVITFRTGGSPEIVDETCGRVVEQNDVKAMLEAIEEQVRTRAMTREACVERAKSFSVERMVDEYIDLYEEILCDKKCD